MFFSMFFSSNIRLLRKRRNRTQDDVATALGMKRSTLSGYENGIAEPGLEALLAFSRYFRVAIDTLVAVDLSALSESQLSELERGFDVYIKGSNLRVLATTVDSRNNENIEMVPEKAKAGYTTGYSDPEFISELPVFQFPLLSKNKKYRTFQISGDSMLPIPEGAWVTGEYVQDWSLISSGTACIVFTSDGGIVFKIIENLLAQDQKIRLHSLNPMYDPYDVPVDEIREIWKFVHYISSEIPEPVLPHQHLVKTVVSLKQELSQIKEQLSKPKNGV